MPLLSARGARRGAGQRGLTLIEITIALLIVGLLVMVATPSIEAVTGIKAREEAGRISGAIRAMYGESALSGKVCRLVFDMDERAWWGECTDDRFTIAREKEQSRDGARLEERKRDPRPIDPNDEGAAMRQQIEKEAEFAALDSEEIPRRQLPNGAELSVWVAHQRERYTKGTSYLYFFPQGHTQRAQVYVSSGHGDYYTLKVSPLNGQVRVFPEELDVPRD